jgi:N-dimethylarginine dimethylaminohydrolase
MGHPTRRGEVGAVRETVNTLKQKGIIQTIVDMQSPATLDGGDVLVMVVIVSYCSDECSPQKSL